MKKLIDLAKELNITPQAIYKRKGTDRLLHDRITSGTVKHGKNTFLDDDAVAAIREAFHQPVAEQDNVQNGQNVQNNSQSVVDALVAQLAEKDKQIATLTMLLNQQQQLTLKTQLLLEPPKKRWWELFMKDKELA